MKNRATPSTKVKSARKTKGRWGRVYLSVKLVEYCQRMQLEPETIACCAGHALALRNPSCIVIENNPDGKEASE